MFFILFYYIVLSIQYSFYEATPLWGDGVRDAYIGEVPFIVSLSWKSPPGIKNVEKGHFCGGCLITHQHVLTAAHCLMNRTLDKVIVKVGDLDLRRAQNHKIEWWITYRQWANITFPPDKDHDSIHDIAVVKLHRAARSDIELPLRTNDGLEQFFGQTVRTGGWGTTENELSPRYMKIAKFSVLLPQNCGAFTSKNPLARDFSPKLYLCTVGNPPATVTCGNSGSPLLTEHDQIIGINKDTQYSFYGGTPLLGERVRDAYLGEFPFIVSLSRINFAQIKESESVHFCGGCLITHQHVLTAAHCLKNKHPGGVVVKAGDLDLRSAKSHEIKWWSTYSQWANVTLPPEYDPEVIYDIAMIGLHDPVSSEIELPIRSYYNLEHRYGEIVKTGGWGKIEYRETPRYMRLAKFFLVRPEQCGAFESRDPLLSELRPKLFLCTRADPPATVTCGDSGSPLISEDNHLLGINKGFCITDRLSTFWNMHASINAYVNFIEAMKDK